MQQDLLVLGSHASRMHPPALCCHAAWPVAPAHPAVLHQHESGPASLQSTGTVLPPSHLLTWPSSQSPRLLIGCCWQRLDAGGQGCWLGGPPQCLDAAVAAADCGGPLTVSVLRPLLQAHPAKVCKGGLMVAVDALQPHTGLEGTPPTRLLDPPGNKNGWSM